MAAVRYLDVSEEEAKKTKENAVALSNYTKTIVLLRLGEYCLIIPSSSSRGLIDIFTSPLANNC